MAITVEHIFDVGAEEEDGFVETLRRQLRLSGLTSTSPDGYVNEILTSPAVPAGGDAVIVRGQVLYLRGRSVDVGDDSPLGGAILNLTYRRSEGGSGDSGTTPTIEVRGGVRQVERAKDGDDNAYELQYTWPENSDAVSPNGKPKAGQTQKVSGILRVFEPEVVLTSEIVKSTNSPGAFVKQYLGRVNATTWQGEGPRHWLCTGGSARPIDLTTSPQQWSFSFAFTLDENGWDTQTTLVFIDPQTGQAPEGIEEGNGLLTVTHYETKDFNGDF